MGTSKGAWGQVLKVVVVVVEEVVEMFWGGLNGWRAGGTERSGEEGGVERDR